MILKAWGKNFMELDGRIKSHSLTNGAANEQ